MSASCSCQRLDDVNSLLGSWSYGAIKWTSLSVRRHSHCLSIFQNDDANLIAPWLLYWQFGSIMLPFSSRAFLISKSANTVAAQMNHIEMPMWLPGHALSRLSALFQSCIRSKLAGDQNQNWVSLDLFREHWTSHSQGTSQVWEDRALEIPSDHGITP